jgi:hypothetical protein
MRPLLRLTTLVASLLLTAWAIAGCSSNDSAGEKMPGAMPSGKMEGAMDKGKMEGAMDKGKMDSAPK